MPFDLAWHLLQAHHGNQHNTGHTVPHRLLLTEKQRELAKLTQQDLLLGQLCLLVKK